MPCGAPARRTGHSRHRGAQGAAIEAPIVRLVTLVDAAPGGLGVESPGAPGRSPLGTAVRERRATGAPGGRPALPVELDGQVVALSNSGRSRWRRITRR